MKERSVTFNHGYLCEMLRAASNVDLAEVINDVKKEQNRRRAAQAEVYAKNIQEAIEKAIDAGFVVKFCVINHEDEPNFYIDDVTLSHNSVYVEPEED